LDDVLGLIEATLAERSDYAAARFTPARIALMNHLGKVHDSLTRDPHVGRFFAERAIRSACRRVVCLDEYKTGL
jgi:hypothetical protein